MEVQNSLQYVTKLINQQLAGVSYLTLAASALSGMILVHLACMFYKRITGKKIGVRREILFFLLTAYACFLFQVTFYNREPESRVGIYTALDFGSLSGDFLSVQQVVYSWLNILLFVPWGALLAFLRNRERAGKRTLMVTLYCFLTSFLIETVQLITSTGFFELGDIVTNVAGGFAGCLIAGAIVRLMEGTDTKET